VQLLLQEKNVVIDYEYSIGYRHVNTSGLLSPTADDVEQRYSLKQNAVQQRVDYIVNEIVTSNKYDDVTYTTDADVARIPNAIMAVGRQVLVVNKTNILPSTGGSADVPFDEFMRGPYEWHYFASSDCSKTCGRGYVGNLLCIAMSCVGSHATGRLKAFYIGVFSNAVKPACISCSFHAVNQADWVFFPTELHWNRIHTHYCLALSLLCCLLDLKHVTAINSNLLHVSV
jgi:hypothetical protein